MGRWPRSEDQERDLQRVAVQKIMITLVIVLSLSAAQLCSAVISRNDRNWPIGRSTSVDLAQSSPFGPRLKISEGSRYTVITCRDLDVTHITAKLIIEITGD